MKYVWTLFVAVSLFGCNEAGTSAADNRRGNSSIEQRNLENSDIRISISGAPTGTAYLIGFFADQRYKADSARVSPTGDIHFKRNSPLEPGLFYLVIPGRLTLQLMVDQDQSFTMSTTAADPVGQMQIEGSLENELLYRNLKYEAAFQPRIQPILQRMKQTEPTSATYSQLRAQQQKLQAERKAHLEEIFSQYPDNLFTVFKKAGQNPDLRDLRMPDGSPDVNAQMYHFRREFWDDVDFSDERLLNTPVIANKLERYITKLTIQRPDSLIAATDHLMSKVMDAPEYYKFFANWIVLQYEPTKTTLMDPEAIYVHMVQNYFTHDKAFWSDSTEIYGLQLRASEMAGSLVGKKAPDVSSTGPDGKTYSIYDIKSPYIVVFMYNPECEHCIEQTPKLKQFYQEWKNKGVEVYGIALDTEDDKWKGFIRQYQLDWINVFDPSNRSIYKKYFVDNTPEIYVINPDRTIIAKNLKVNQIEEVIRRDQS